MTNEETYGAMVEARTAQQERFRGKEQDRWGGNTAGRFRMDPRRPLNPNLEAIASYVSPADVFIDVGGGAGRVGLPMALRCKEVINAEPSAGMQAVFRDLSAQAGISNARSVEADWLAAEGVEGDICFTAHVTYFIKEIVPFVRKMEAAARKRVVISVNSVPLPNLFAPSAELLYGERFCPVPGQRELLPVLWDMDILPEVRVLPEAEGIAQMSATTREDAVQRRLIDFPGTAEERRRAERLLHEHFDEVFMKDGGLYIARGMVGTRGVLITWEPSR